ESQVLARTTELLLANEALRTSQEHYRLLSDLLPDAVFVHARGNIIFANPEMVRLMEADSVDEVLGLSAIDIISPENQERIAKARQRLTDGESRIILQDVTFRTLHGNTVEVDGFASQTIWNDQEAFLVVARDISDQKKLEQQLRLAQRLEAVGQLTGGIAHDVNNLLAVIQGNTEFLADEIGHDNEMLRSILRASRRGAELTQRLLAFSRQQQLQPKSLDLSSLVDDLHQLLDRTLGERIDVRLSTDPDLWPATADPGQVENVILNLAINARDAMPDGGTLTISCRNAVIDEMTAAGHADAQPGEYAMLSVRDTGTGMPEDVKSRIFEPFFTTKEFGKGSGLGLSMVYGFVRQSGGLVTVDSEPGAGTEILLYLPRAHSDADETSAPEDRDLLRGRGEHILVVEDDDEVRTLVAISLTNLGYKVTDYPTAERGLALLQQGRVDLILSDVVLLGEMTGPDLLNAARALYPDVGALLMSGYPADANVITAYPVLRKPFQRAQLAQSVRESLSPQDTSTQRDDAGG
ncbi:MAG: ATP-binding protein, partial [Proteobacteria bacterium]|nr:ATP-binding protein [Pseudomonadota bacterium]